MAEINRINEERNQLENISDIANKAREDAKKEENTVQENKKEEENKTEETNNKSNDESNKQERKATNKNVIVIDPGHQTRGNSEKEPIGPGASETKAKVTGGATGVSTGQTEYNLNLKVALKLRDALEAKGYTVIMTRTTNDVNISNSERAKIANEAGAAVFIRIHANSVDSSSTKGVLTMCQTSSNVYNGDLAGESYKLSKAVLNNFVEATGAVNKGVTRTDTMSGINWCTVPTTIVEMGFLSNPEEDELMATDEYQDKMVSGMVNGIIEYLND
ncbi:MAG: N-acetylmuramoyl-L-alanine amidase [Clostridia bacterium]|nr:N-acetylmuramoyl-L-alanine amidase [Clostridia bacterium]